MKRDLALGAGRPARRSLLSRFRAYTAMRRQRTALGDLDDHALRDIGLSRAEARREARRPFWDVPDHWTR
ncbi:hypothetical protein OCH239_20490 [Roseivivax halodurans JCM 10272]|uniref:YjiS-like domain-containing protein n=1 Tax=Roseivivax halodurans JCM 10272 TaxID=1449350 RepID=X7EFT0_9RHOB|nr:DUF1127 domain-containing protein [Roseivivax halodurans]ETX14745.1 hypothetical protein OCH239_20490 [Roseivivax halodurans JCM 10272]